VIWLGDRSGYLSDWVTQQWVRLTGCRVNLENDSWLNGPKGNTRIIGKEFFEDYARTQHLRSSQSEPRGLLQDFSDLSGRCNDPNVVASAVKDFYERTSEYELDAWSEWHGLARPFGTALAVIFSRRLQQLNIPLSPLDTSKGMSSSVIQLLDPHSGRAVQTAWVRELRATRNVLYAGSYSVCVVPGYESPCVKVVFPLPNGNAVVIMKPESYLDGSLSLTSAGNGFGDPGFYFVNHDRDGKVWARYVHALKERISVYHAEHNTVRADHILWIWGRQFLRLHYRMRVTAERGVPAIQEAKCTI
jgi:hypothetical protein